MWQVDKVDTIKKIEGKGGWHYVLIPEIASNPKTPFGWVQVKGFIDTFALNQYKLMPFGNGQLFLPIRAEIRKKLNKKQGDLIHVLLKVDDSTLHISAEFSQMLSLAGSNLLQTFTNLPLQTQQMWLKQFHQAKNQTLQTKISLLLIENLEKQE